jgi:outer membrane scaffolding protein for murein synthesis (MipA/OmpV family)
MRPFRVPSLGLFAFLGLAALAASPAAAQSYDPFGIFGDRWQVGGLVYVSPKYEGSKSYSAIGFPVIAPAGLGDAGIIQVYGIDDIRWRAFQFSGFEFGPLGGYRFGRDEEDGARLRGTGDIDGGLVLGGFATYRTGPLAFSVSYHHQASGDETGGLFRMQGQLVTPLAPGVKMTTTLGTNYATDDYMTSFFGVNAAQAKASGLAFYAPSAGFKDVFAGAVGSIDLNDRWTLMLIGRYSRLIGDAADSPIIETENQFYGGAALTYKFSLGQ